jgi:hypothetical protein
MVSSDVELGIKSFKLPLTSLHNCYLISLPNHSVLLRHTCFMLEMFLCMESGVGRDGWGEGGSYTVQCTTRYAGIQNLCRFSAQFDGISKFS